MDLTPCLSRIVQEVDGKPSALHEASSKKTLSMRSPPQLRCQAALGRRDREGFCREHDGRREREREREREHP